MSEWYYASGGKQSGPVGFGELVAIARGGGLAPGDLVWTSTMKDWQPAGKVPGIFADPANPYSAPDSAWTEVARTLAGEALPEIPPGSERIDVGRCVKRAFDLTCREFGMILLVVIVYLAVSIGASVLLGLMDTAMGWGHHEAEFKNESTNINFYVREYGSPLNTILTHVLSIFLSLGATRIGLNVVSGKPFSIGMLFDGGRKLLPAVGASILYGLMVGLGLLLLIVPGIYLAVRYGQFMAAMVDRDMGIMESFRYSSTITENNRMNLFLLLLLSFLILIAGFLALCVGLLFAFPVMWLGWIVAYRWLQYGHRAALDYPGTTTPMLAAFPGQTSA